MADLSNKRVAILVDNYFEEPEFTGPLEDLKQAGAQVDVVATETGELQALRHAEPGETFKADRSLDEVNMDDYDALVLPGGAVNADHLRMNDKAREWIKKFMDERKPLAAICHAPWALASAGVTKGRRLTSYFTIQDDMRNAGAEWVDEDVVVDDNLITSRDPDDLSAFDSTLIQMLQTT
jgi:protease I